MGIKFFSQNFTIHKQAGGGGEGGGGEHQDLNQGSKSEWTKVKKD